MNMILNMIKIISLNITIRIVTIMDISIGMVTSINVILGIVMVTSIGMIISMILKMILRGRPPLTDPMTLHGNYGKTLHGNYGTLHGNYGELPTKLHKKNNLPTDHHNNLITTPQLN